MNYVTIIMKSIIVYIVMIVALRLMGKREVGELSIFDIVIYLVMSELLAISISEKENIFKALIPIFTLVLLQISIAYLSLKIKKFRNLVDGKSVILIEHGHVYEDRMRENRYNIDDLMAQLRVNKISSINDIAFAVLENNGQLTILEKNHCHLRYPDPLICDGEIDYEVLKACNIEEEWLLKQLESKKIHSVKEVFICMLEKDDLFVLKKGMVKKTNSMKNRCNKHA